MKKILRSLLFITFIMSIMFVNTLAEENNEVTVVKSDKVWTIVFNKTVSEDMLENITVKDSEEKIINVSLEIKDEKEILIYPPEGEYQPSKEYTIFINKKENGLKEDYEIKFKVISEIKRVSQLWDYTFQDNEYEAPKVVEAILENGEKVNVPVEWDEEIVTNKIGDFTHVGKVKGFDKKVNLYLVVFPKVISVKDSHIRLYIGDDYSLPEKVEVKYLDGTTGMESVNWTNNELDIKKAGEYTCEGKIQGYDKLITANVIVESNFLISHTYPSENEEIQKLKFGYMDIVFSKDTIRSYDVDKIILKDQNGVRIRIKKTQPGVTAKNNFLIIPNRHLDSNTQYTLFVPNGLIKSADGEVYQKDIEIKFKTK